MQLHHRLSDRTTIVKMKGLFSLQKNCSRVCRLLMRLKHDVWHKQTQCLRVTQGGEWG